MTKHVHGRVKFAKQALPSRKVISTPENSQRCSYQSQLPQTRDQEGSSKKSGKEQVPGF